jgi:hypothetical protein
MVAHELDDLCLHWDEPCGLASGLGRPERNGFEAERRV